MKIRFLSVANQEVADAVEWYESKEVERRLMNLLNRNYDDVESVSPLLNQVISEFDCAEMAARTALHRKA